MLKNDIPYFTPHLNESLIDRNTKAQKIAELFQNGK